MNRRWSIDSRLSPGWPYDQVDNPDVLHPRIFPTLHTPTPNLHIPKITEVGTVHIVKIVFERDLGRGLVLREAHLFPYGEVQTKWRHLLMKYLLEGRPRAQRDDINEWAYFEYELAHNLPRNSIMEWYPANLPFPLVEPLNVRHYNPDADHEQLDETTRVFRNLGNLARAAELDSEDSDVTIDPDAHLYMARQLPTRVTLPSSPPEPYSYAYLDTAADMCGIGGDAWVIDALTDRQTALGGYDTSTTVKTNVPIGSGITAIDLPDGETILLKVNEATILGPEGHSLLSVVQIREHGIELDEKPRLHGGTACMVIDDYVIPFTMVEGLLVLKYASLPRKN